MTVQLPVPVPVPLPKGGYGSNSMLLICDLGDSYTPFPYPLHISVCHFQYLQPYLYLMMSVIS